MENYAFKIYWDLTMMKKEENYAVIIDFAVPLDCNLKKSYGEMINGYEALSRR